MAPPTLADVTPPELDQPEVVLLDVDALGDDGDCVVLDVTTPPIEGLVEPELLAGFAPNPNNELKACAGCITAPVMNPPIPEPFPQKSFVQASRPFPSRPRAEAFHLRRQ